MFDVRSVKPPAKNKFNGQVGHTVGKLSDFPQCNMFLAALCLSDFVHRTVCINGVDGKVTAHTPGNADVPGIGGILEITFFILHQEAYTSLTIQSIEAVGLQTYIRRGLACARTIAGELTHVATLT